MTVVALVSTIATFVAIVGVGAGLRALGVVGREAARPINQVIIYVGLPAFIFRAVYTAELHVDLLGVVAVALAVFAVMLGLGWLAARLLKLPDELAGGFIIAVALGNTGYIGYPVTSALFGDRELPAAIFFDVFGTVVALSMVGLLVAQHFGHNEEARVNPIRELVTFPAVIALLAALALKAVPIPNPVMAGLELLANMVAPLIMIAVGLSLQPKTLGSKAGQLAIIGALRLIVAPLIALALGLVVLGQTPALRVTVLEAGTPAMMLTLAVGERFGLDTDFIASAILATTAASIVTLPLFQLLAFR